MKASTMKHLGTICQILTAIFGGFVALTVVSMTYLWQDNTTPAVLGNYTITKVKPGGAALLTVDVISYRRGCELQVSKQILDSSGRPHLGTPIPPYSAAMIEQVLKRNNGKFHAGVIFPEETARGKAQISFRLAFSCNRIQQAMPLILTYEVETEVL